MYQLIIRSVAAKMAKEAYEWYDEQQAGLGDVFFSELQSCYDKLESWPEAYPKIKKHYRPLVMHKFPYVIIFEISGSNVVVYSIFHTSQNPTKKFRKK